MKITSLIAGVAAVALTAGAASAQTAVTSTSWVGNNAGTVGGPTGPASATFDITANVAADCVLGLTGGSTVDFGSLGINADESAGVENVFRLASGAHYAGVETNMAGCNAKNTVTLTKGSVNGLLNSSAQGQGYDTNVFQASIPYYVYGAYAAGGYGEVAAQSRAYHVNVQPNQQTGSQAHGAWLSAFGINVTLVAPAKALVAGNYKDTLKVDLATTL